MVKESLKALLTRVALILNQHCYGYVVGGFVRDWLLGRETEDVDIAVSGDALEIAMIVAQELRGKCVVLEETRGQARVVLTDEEPRCHLDFTAFSGSIDEDLSRRDFTINAMAIALSQLKTDSFMVIDPFGGRDDLSSGLIRVVKDGVFEEDALRLLRAVRLASELGFTIEEKTQALISCHSSLISQVSGERVREELLKLLAHSASYQFLSQLDRLGLLTVIVPELAEGKGVTQPKEHYWDVFSHSLETVAALEFLLRETNWVYASPDILAWVPWSEKIAAYFTEPVAGGSNRQQLLKLAGLLHDVAKPGTRSIDEAGKMRFLGHTKEGAAMAAAILERLRFSNRETKLVENIIYHHLRPVQMAQNGMPSSRAIYRFFRDTEGAGIDILFLALADYLATHGPNLDLGEWQEHNQRINYILQKHFEQEEKVLPVKLVSGDDLISIFGLSPGPLVGELLGIVREAQAAGELGSRGEALALIKKELSKRQRKG